ncbi:MAG TPA: amidase [Opitutaceae bacterium]
MNPTLPSADLDRRRFLYFSLLGATAAALGGKSAHGQTAAGRATGPTSPPTTTSAAVSSGLGNGEAPALQFMPHPEGTGAVMEKLVQERGADAFKRTVFTPARWAGAVPESAAEIAFLPAHRLSALIKARKLTSVRLTEIYLARLKWYNPILLCAVTILRESALAEAAQADAEIAAGRYRGPLHGLPYGLKDLFAARGTPTTWGSPDFQDQVLDYDAEIVTRLRAAGAVLVAKLSTGIFAQNDQWFRGRTNNPWNPVQGSSGSSAGPGSATAAGLVAFAIGTETQGSITSPSIRNGISALRPTFGRVSRHGGMVLAWSQDRVGPMCRTIEDCAMVFSAIHGVDPKDASTVTMPFAFNPKLKLSTLRIGYDEASPPELVDGLRALGANPVLIGARPRPQDYGLGMGGLNAEYAAAFDFLVQRKAEEIGLDLSTLVPPAAKPGGMNAPYGNIPAAYTQSPMAPANWNPRFVNGRTISAHEYLNAQRRRLLYIQKYHEVMGDLDLFVSSAPGWDVAANAQTGHPCVVVPYTFAVPTQAANANPVLDLKAQPIGGILIGALYRDDVLLSVAHQLQMANGIADRHPTLPA